MDLPGYGLHSTVPSIVSSAGGRRVALIAGPTRRYSTVQAAINAAGNGDQIFIDPGEYAEQITIPFTKNNLVLIGMGGRGSVAIQAAETTATIQNHARDVTLINVGAEGDGTGGGLTNYGRRLRAYGCKFEGGANAVKLTLGTAAQVAAETHDDGSDCLLEDCELCWSDNGVLVAASDHGAVTQAFFKNCRLHNLADSSFEEVGGSAGVRYRDLHIDGCLFGLLEDGTAPTAYILLNDDNANSGIVTRCVFPTALNGGLNLVSTALAWVGNLHPAGLSTGQPS